MEKLFALVAYVPSVGLGVGFMMLATGVLWKNHKKQQAKALMTAGTWCVGVSLVVLMALFAIGAVGLGPVPS